LKKIEFTLKENCKSKRRKKRKACSIARCGMAPLNVPLRFNTVKAEEAKAEYRDA